MKNVIENYFLMPNEDAYDKAKQLLNHRYGNSFVNAKAFCDKLENWPTLTIEMQSDYDNLEIFINNAIQVCRVLEA